MFSSKKMAAAALLLFCFMQITAQKIIIKGKIIDEKGSPIPFASVFIKGTKLVDTTNEAGIFSLQSKTKSITLSCSIIGYDATEKKLLPSDFKDSVTVITIALKATTKTLNEVVVVGYATAKKASKITYASASVSTAHFVSAPASTPSTKLEGRVSGISVEAGETSSVKLKSSISVAATDDGYRDKAVTDMPSYKKPTAEKRTSLLTAGEVTDFKKWKMWEDYNETDFKTYSSNWNLYATQRYSVQLKNKDNKAVVGETVTLVNKETNEIIWVAVSDNTGKAELWNGFADGSKNNSLSIEVKNERKIYNAAPFAQGINHIQLNRSCTVSNKVEIAFVVDATGSMGDEIEYLKEELQDILLKVSVKDPSLDMHTASVFYRDKGDDYVTSLQPFTKGIASTIDFIKKQTAGGGGDYPEALKEALQDATEKLEWNNEARAKIIFLLIDAPPHDEAKDEMAALIAKAAAKGIRIVPVACSGTDKATEFIMRSMALATNGTYLFLTDDSAIGNPHIKPTTDEFKVELLNDLLQRVIEQMCFVNSCSGNAKKEEPFSLYANNEKAKVFPNPTNGPATLETDAELTEIFVADFTGKILMRTKARGTKKQYKIDLSNYPSATYFIRYITKENKTGAEKIVLIH